MYVRNIDRNRSDVCECCGGEDNVWESQLVDDNGEEVMCVVLCHDCRQVLYYGLLYADGD